MNQEQQIILSILKKVFSNPKKEYDDLTWYEFNCPRPTCKHDHNKFNLTYNIEANFFRCWKCKYKGYVHDLIEKYGIKEDLDRLLIVLPKDYFVKKEKPKIEYDENITCELPDGYVSLATKSNSRFYKKAISYLKKRRVDLEIIKKYKIGYTETGSRSFRIIIPSYNNNGDVNYYEARSYFPWVKPDYHKPDEPNKSKIIFNICNINFDLPVYLVEGVFDMFPLYNCIPLLGKDIPDILLEQLIEHKTNIILCLDEDAIMDTINLYNKLTSYGLEVYFVEIKDDIAKFYEKFGKEKLIELLRTYRKLDFDYIFNLAFKKKKKSNNKRYLYAMSKELKNF